MNYAEYREILLPFFFSHPPKVMENYYIYIGYLIDKSILEKSPLKEMARKEEWSKCVIYRGAK